MQVLVEEDEAQTNHGGVGDSGHEAEQPDSPINRTQQDNLRFCDSAARDRRFAS